VEPYLYFLVYLPGVYRDNLNYAFVVSAATPVLNLQYRAENCVNI